MEMRKRIPVNATLDPEVVKDIDEWVARQTYRTSRAAFLEVAAKKLLAEEKAKVAEKRAALNQLTQ